MTDNSQAERGVMIFDIEQRKHFLLIDGADCKRLVAIKPLAEKNATAIIDGLYEHFLAYTATKSFFQSERHIDNLKAAQGRFFMKIVDGVYDGDYMESRLSVGRTHERIGLEPQWYIGAYCRYLNLIIPFLFEEFRGKPQELMTHIQSMLKVVFLDMGFAIDTYIQAMQIREADLKKGFVEALTEYSKNLGSSTTGIVAAVAEQSAAITQQSTSIAEVTTTIGELKQTSQQAQENSQLVIDAADGAVAVSRQGTQAVEEAIKGMHDIQKQVEAIAEKILNLSEQTQQIGEIIQSVNEISEQSKLLALNAAIEAARAGEHGKGFSVVASEIRTLADQSKQATTQVRGILGEIQKATNSAVIATEEGGKKVESGVGLANRAGENIHQLSQAIDRNADSGRLIASSSKQQSAGIDQVAVAMQQINQAAKDTSNALKNTEESARMLANLSAQMGKLLETFTTTEKRTVDWKLA